MLCPNCSTQLPDGARFCGACGTSLDAAPDPTLVQAGYPASPPPPAPPTSFAPPPAPAAGGGSKKGLVIGIVALLVVAAVVGGFLVFGGGDDDVAAGGGDGDVGVILLEPLGVRLDNDFAGDLELDRPSRAPAMRGLPPLSAAGASVKRTGAAKEAAGDEPGLYGGTRDAATCDVEQLVDFLTDEDNADKAEAWAAVHDIEVDELSDFVAGLTPVRLRFDTRVTNHGFTDGEATPAQSILEAGTAVLVDDEGVPRVKCNCGNPLLEPEEVGDDPEIANEDDAWDDFDLDEVVAVEPGDAVDEFVLVDFEGGDLYTRPVGTDGDDDRDVDGDLLDDLCETLGESPSCEGGEATTTTDGGDTTTTTDGGDTTTSSSIVLGTGDVQVTLRWRSAADLDLAVVDPNGERIDFVTRTSSSGGELDVDSNVGCEAEGSVENIFWPPATAPSGTYTIEVDGFDASSCGQSGAFDLTVLANGQLQTFSGDVSDESTQTFTFTVG